MWAIVLVWVTFQFVTKEAEEDLQKGFAPTLNAPQWALKVFSSWKTARVHALEEACPNNLLVVPILPSGYLYSNSCFQSIGRTSSKYEVSGTTCTQFLDKKDPRFKLLHNGLNNLYQKLSTMNIGTCSCQALRSDL